MVESIVTIALTINNIESKRRWSHSVRRMTIEFGMNSSVTAGSNDLGRLSRYNAT